MADLEAPLTQPSLRSSRLLRIRTYSLIAALVVFSSVGNLFLSIGMKRIGTLESFAPAMLFSHFVRIVTSGTIWLGIGFLLLFFVCYLTVLSWADFSFVKPSMAIGYAFVTLLGFLVLGEHVTAMRWFGVALICSGVALVGRTEVRTTAP
jgi:drug/metabolite transporter (DMT)-like permease